MSESRITVVGCGHVGLVTAVGLAILGHRVTGVDRNATLVGRLGRGIVDLQEPGLEEALHRTSVTFTTSFEDVGEADFVFLCVDTPPTIAGAASLTSVRAAVESIALHLNGNNPIIVNKSTSPIGTGETIATLLSAHLAPRSPRIVSNPEFLRQGHALDDFLNPDRIVVGAQDPNDAAAVLDLYVRLDGPAVTTDLRSAEMIKYVANAFLATRVSFINEIARLCDAVAVDIDTVVEGIAHDPRIGGAMFSPGPGYGGSCLPKDVAALRFTGEAFGVPTPLLSAVQEVNAAAKTGIVRRLRRLLGTLEGRRVAVWGLTFKADTEDTRDSPAVDVVDLLVNEGCVVRAFDPAVAVNNDRAPSRLRALLSPSGGTAVTGAEALLILTDWPQFSWTPWVEMRDLMTRPLVIDARNMLVPEYLVASGFEYEGVGRVIATLEADLAVLR